MTEIVKRACAGTLESSDTFVENESAEGLELDVQSAVLAQFGDAIRATVTDVLRTFGVENARVRVVDQGALDCVIRARVETAIRRGTEGRI